MNEVDEIKSRLDLVDLISQYVTLKKAGVNYKGVCPFHQEKTPSLMVSPQKQIWKCFGCLRGGDVYNFIMEIENLEFGDALRLLAQKAGVTLQPRTQAEHQTQNQKQSLYRINDLASRIFEKVLWEHPDGLTALEYLKKRNITEQTIKQFRLGWASRQVDLKSQMLKRGVTAAELSKAGSPERFFERIMFPIFDVLGNVIAFTGRTLGDAQPKYLNSPETPLFNKSRTIYGLNLAKTAIKDKGHVILVEGQVDVLALHQAGFAHAVASSGTAITEAQLLILSKYTPNFLLAFDNDSAGQTTTRKVIELLLKNDLNSKVIDFGQYKDAGEMLEKSPEAFRMAARETIEGVEWIFRQEIAKNSPITFIENKKKTIKALLPVLGLITDAPQLDHYVQKLARLTEAKPESVYAALQKTKSTPAPAAPNVKHAQPTATLTNEEQLLAIILHQPSLLIPLQKQFNDLVWQSVDAQRIAEAIESCYNDRTLVNNQARFFSQVKTHLDSQQNEKIDSWQFWLTQNWPDFTPALAEELAKEKISQLATKKYEQQKNRLAMQIRQAQESHDFTKVKDLMTELNQLTKGGND